MPRSSPGARTPAHTLSTLDFSHLRKHDPTLLQLMEQAREYSDDDAVASLMKLRLFGETLAQKISERHAISHDGLTADQLLKRLEAKRLLPRNVALAFHRVKREGNGAVHGEPKSPREARATLALAHDLGLWFDQLENQSSAPVRTPRGPSIPTSPARSLLPPNRPVQRKSAAEILRDRLGRESAQTSLRPRTS